MIDNREVGRRIAQLRQDAGLTQVQLAAMMNVSHQAVSKWEGGQALPDIQTLMALSSFFGVTVEQLVGEDRAEDSGAGEGGEGAQGAPENPAESEGSHMNLAQLLQMAPYMTKEAVSEIALGMEGPLSAGQIARLAPYLSQECVEALIEKHQPVFSWDSLRRLAPHMRREKVDELARSIASGERTVESPEESFNKTMNDIGRAFDGIGKGVDKAVRKALRFGESMLNEVSSAISELSNNAAAAPEERERSERARALRQRAFERALADGKWDWLGEHIDELENGSELKRSIAERARELGMHDWICAHMGGYADEFTIEAAIRGGNWSWLGDNLWQLEPGLRLRAARAALEAENWQWLGAHSRDIDLGEEALGFARTLREKGAKLLALQIARDGLGAESLDEFAREAVEAGDEEMADLMWDCLSDGYARERLLELARAGDWSRVEAHIDRADAECVEALMEQAVEDGNFDAVDFLDRYL